MIKIDGKFMHETTKKGWVIQDYLNHFDVSEKDFFDCLKKTFSKKAFQRIVRRLKSNQKQQKQQRQQKQQNTSSPSVTPVLPIPSDTSTDTEEKTTQSSIEVLEDEEKVLSDLLCKKESERVRLISERNKLKKVFISQRSILFTLVRQLEDSQTIVNNSYQEYLKTSSAIDNINDEISKAQKTLESIREEIQELKKVSIFVYENGEIEIDNTDISLLTDSAEETKLFNDLLHNELVECLTVKQIRQLSRVIIVVKSILDSGLKYELTFESSSLEEVYQQIK